MYTYMVIFYEIFSLWSLKNHDMKGCGSCHFGCHRLYPILASLTPVPLSPLKVLTETAATKLCHIRGSE